MEQQIIEGRLSQRGVGNVANLIKRMPKTILDAGNTADESSIIDLSVAENWLIRNGILEIQRSVVQDSLQAQVSRPASPLREEFSLVTSLTGEPGCGSTASVMAKRFFGVILIFWRPSQVFSTSTSIRAS